MLRKTMVWLVLLALLPLTALAGEAQKVFAPDETEPFPEDAALLTLRVCPLLGADCMLLTLGDHTMLIDAGRDDHFSDISAMLAEAGVTEAEYVLNTHPHVDHAGSVKPLLEAGFGMGTFITLFPHDYADNTPGAQRVIQKSTIAALEAAGVPILDLKTQDTIPFGDALLTIYQVPDDRLTAKWDCNNRSAMLMIQYGACRALLTADVETLAQGVLAELYDLRADILKFPHHGVRPAVQAFLDAVRPEYVFFTHGTKNTLDAQKQLVKKGYERMTFASWGLITAQTDGEKWIVWQDVKPDLAEYARKYKIGQ